MDWIIINSADIDCALNKPQFEILKSQRLREPTKDVVQDIISNVVVRIRAEIAASGGNCLDEDHSRIPPELKECALRLAVEALHLRIPSMELSKSQEKHADLARETLSRVARGELPVSRPVFAISTGDSRRGISAASANRKADCKSLEAL